MAIPTSRPTAKNEPAGERLQKLLSHAGVASRRHAEALIRAGRVAVNGEVVVRLGTRADPARDVISVDGERLVFGGPRRTIAVHKPRGVVATMDDPEGRPTVRDIVAGLRERLYPIGRLDVQTTGLLLLTNDGELAAGLLRGDRAALRLYHVKVHGLPSASALGRLRRGIRLDDGPPVVATVRVLRERPTKTWLEIGVRRGQWHVVRRLCEAIGHPVDKLARVAFGPVRLGDLAPGAWRDLTRAELADLRVAAGLSAARPGDAPARALAGRAQGKRRRTAPPAAGPRRRPRPHSGR